MTFSDSTRFLAQIRLIYNGVDVHRFCPDSRAQYRQTTRRQLGVSDQTLLALIVAHNFRLKRCPDATSRHASLYLASTCLFARSSWVESKNTWGRGVGWPVVLVWTAT